MKRGGVARGGQTALSTGGPALQGCGAGGAGQSGQSPSLRGSPRASARGNLQPRVETVRTHGGNRNHSSARLGPSAKAERKSRKQTRRPSREREGRPATETGEKPRV